MLPEKQKKQIISDYAMQYILKIKDEINIVGNSMVKIGHLLNDAETNLPPVEYKEILNKIELGERSIQKLKRIATDKRIEMNIDSLPSSWGTLYEITKLNDEQFDSAIEHGDLTPDTQRKQVTSLLKNQKNSNPEKKEKVILLLNISVKDELTDENIDRIEKAIEYLGGDFIIEGKFFDMMMNLEEKEFEATLNADFKSAKKVIRSRIKQIKQGLNGKNKTAEFHKIYGGKDEIEAMPIPTLLNLLGCDEEFPMLGGLTIKG